MALTYSINIGGTTLDNGDIVTLIRVENSINSKYQNAIISYGGDSPSPTINDSVTININSTTVFNGYVSRIEKDLKGIKVWKLQCIGNTYDLWREHIDDSYTHTFSNTNTGYMVSSLVSDYSNLTFPQSDTIGQSLTGEYDFEDMCLGDAVKKINSFDSYNFYVNGSSELIYYEPNTTQSLTVTESNLIEKSKFEESDDEIYNKVLVKGDGVSYTDNNTISESNYGKHFLKVDEPIIDNATDAQTLAESYVTEYKDPVLYGSVVIRGDTSVDISRQFTLNLTNLGISETPKIVSYGHVIDKKGFRTKIQFGREQYEPAQEFEFLRRSQSNSKYGVYKALADAASAEAASDGKINSYWCDSSGSISNPTEGDIWFDTNDGNRVYRYDSDSNTWVDAQDDDISWAMVSAANARSIADSKIRTFYSTSLPASAKVSYGDIWFETDATSEENALWFANVDGASDYSDWDTASDFRADWSKINDDDENRPRPADGATVNDVIKGNTEPTCDATKTNNLWIDDSDSDNLVVHICDGTNWQRSSRKVFRGSSKPTGGNYVDGDLWVDSSTLMTFQYDTTASDWILASQHINYVSDVSNVSSPKDEMLVWGKNGSKGPALWEYDTSDSSWHNASVTTADEVNAEARLVWGSSPPSDENAWWIDTRRWDNGGGDKQDNDVLRRYDGAGDISDPSNWEKKSSSHLAEMDGNSDNITEGDVQMWADEHGADVTSDHAHDITDSVTSYSWLPTCDPSIQGHIYRVGDKERCYRCNGNQWQKMGDATSDHNDDVYLSNLGSRNHDDLLTSSIEESQHHPNYVYGGQHFDAGIQPDTILTNSYDCDIMIFMNYSAIVYDLFDYVQVTFEIRETASDSWNGMCWTKIKSWDDKTALDNWTFCGGGVPSGWQFRFVKNEGNGGQFLRRGCHVVELKTTNE